MRAAGTTSSSTSATALRDAEEAKAALIEQAVTKGRERAELLARSAGVRLGGIQYLVNDRGGCCVRLDSYGNVMGVSYE